MGVWGGWGGRGGLRAAGDYWKVFSPRARPRRREGALLLPQTPGLGMQLDDSKIETNVVLNWE